MLLYGQILGTFILPEKTGTPSRQGLFNKWDDIDKIKKIICSPTPITLTDSTHDHKNNYFDVVGSLEGAKKFKKC